MIQTLRGERIEPYTDDGRPPDEDNPRGYFEHGNATQLHRRVDWLSARQLAAFLGQPFDEEGAVRAEDPPLRRQRGAMP